MVISMAQPMEGTPRARQPMGMDREMVTTRWVVAGIDASPRAHHVARTAARLGHDLGVRVALVHAAGHDSRYFVGDRRLDVLAECREMLQEVAEGAGLGDETETRVVLGDPATALVRTAGELRTDLLVVGSRGRGPLRAGLLGSVSRRLATMTPCPLVVVSPALRAPEPAPAAVVCGVGGDDSSDQAVRVADDLAARLGLGLVLVHATADSALASVPAATGITHHHAALLEAERDQALRQLKDKARLAPAAEDVELAFEFGDPAARLQDVASRQRAACLVVGSHGRRALEAALVGSVSGRLAAEADRPVVIVPG
jgi:nucleotide-binding universal stress UspA family protein